MEKGKELETAEEGHGDGLSNLPESRTPKSQLGYAARENQTTPNEQLLKKSMGNSK